MATFPTLFLNKTNENFSPSSRTKWYLISYLLILSGVKKEEHCKWETKDIINANIANFVCLWKPQTIAYNFANNKKNQLQNILIFYVLFTMAFQTEGFRPLNYHIISFFTQNSRVYYLSNKNEIKIFWLFIFWFEQRMGLSSWKYVIFFSPTATTGLFETLKQLHYDACDQIK